VWGEGGAGQRPFPVSYAYGWAPGPPPAKSGPDFASAVGDLPQTPLEDTTALSGALQCPSWIWGGEAMEREGRERARRKKNTEEKGREIQHLSKNSGYGLGRVRGVIVRALLLTILTFTHVSIKTCIFCLVSFARRRSRPGYSTPWCASLLMLSSCIARRLMNTTWVGLHIQALACARRTSILTGIILLRVGKAR